MRRAAGAACALLLAGCLLGCAAGGGAAASRERTVTVFAAASLTDALRDLADRFEATHPGTRVVTSFAGSPALVAQVRHGAPADVVITADAETLAGLETVLAGPPRTIARNRLAIVTAPGNPLGVSTLADLGRPGVSVVLAGPAVPAGKAARRALADAGVAVRPVSEEPDVKAVLAKVRLGAADAGIAYVTDLVAAEADVDGTPLPGPAGVYPAAVLADAREPDLARDLVRFLTSAQAQQVLAEHGFLPPSPQGP